MQRQSQISTLKSLIKKISSDITEIKLRSINNLHNKIIHNLIDSTLLINFPQLPGTLMNWINDESQEPEQAVALNTIQTLLKVLTILTTYINYEQGLILLKQYQCLQFCEGFRKYFNRSWAIKCTKTMVQDILQKLDAIINKLQVLGRSQPQQRHQQIQDRIKPQCQDKIEKKYENRHQTQKMCLKFKVLMIKIPQKVQKRIFDNIVQIKYNKKSQRQHHLQQLYLLLKNYNKYYLRNKSEIFQLMNQLLNQHKFITNIQQQSKYYYFQIVCEIVCVLLDGLIWSHQQSTTFKKQATHYNAIYHQQIKNQDTGCFQQLPSIQQQISITNYITQALEGCIIINKLIQISVKFPQSSIFEQYQLYNLAYKYSPQIYLQLLNKLPQQSHFQHLTIMSQNITAYCQKFPQYIPKFTQYLPQNITNQISKLTQYKNSTKQQTSYQRFRKYFGKNFQLSRNMHQINQVINQLELGMEGIIMDPCYYIKVYVNVWLTLAISVMRQDPLMSYYPKIKQLIIQVASSKYQRVSVAFYLLVYHILSQQESTIQYLDSIQRKSAIVQIIFCQQALMDQIFQISLDSEKTLKIILQISEYLCLKNRHNLLIKYVSIFHACCYHQSPQIAGIAQNVLKSIPKKHKIILIFFKLFSQDVEIRCSVLQQLTQSDQKGIHIRDLVLKISEGYFKSTKKQLKISKQSIINYINIILNNDLQIQIRRQAAIQLNDSIQRMNISQAPRQQLSQFNQVLHENLYNAVKLKEDQQLVERYAHLYANICIKIQIFQNQADLQFLASLLSLVKNDKIKASILILMYQKCFQSPFSRQIICKSWIMKFYPHLQVLQIPLQTPTRVFQQQKISRQQPIKNTEKKYKQVQNFKQFYTSSVIELINNQVYPPSNIFEKFIISSTSHNNPYQISKLRFLFTLPNYFNNFKNKSMISEYHNISAFLINHITALKTYNQHYFGMHINLSIIIDVLGYKRTKNLQNYLLQLNGQIQSLNKLYLWRRMVQKDFDSTKQGIEKMLKICDADGEPQILNQIYSILLNKRSINWVEYGDYPNLKLLQSLIKVIKHQFPITFKLKALLLLKKYLKECTQDKISEHKASLIGLFTIMLFERKQITVGELAQILDCIKICIKSFQNGQLPFYRRVIKKISNIIKIIFINTSNSHQIDTPILIGSCLSVFNEGLKLYMNAELQTESGVQILKQTFKNNSIIDTIVLLLNQKIILPLFSRQYHKTKQKLYHTLSTIFEYLYLQCLRVSQNIEYLLKSTNVLEDIVQYVFIQYHDNKQQQCGVYQFSCIHHLGDLVGILCADPDNFYMKLTRILNQGQSQLPKISEFLITMSRPIQKISFFNHNTSKPINSYLCAFNWMLINWQQSTEINCKYPICRLNLPIKNLINSFIAIKNIALVHVLGMGNIAAQKQILNCEQINNFFKQKLKFLDKNVIIDHKSKKKRKSRNQDHLRKTEDIFDQMREFLVFLCTLFTPLSTMNPQQQQSQDQQSYQPTYMQRQNITITIKYIQKLFQYLYSSQMPLEKNQQKQQIKKLLKKLLVNYFNNPLALQTISNYISEGNCKFVDHLISSCLKIGHKQQNYQQDCGSQKQNLIMLGQLSCCQSVRSLIYKNRLIQDLNSKLLKMQENKTTKYDYTLIYHVFTFYSFISLYKEANLKILNDKKLLDFICRALSFQKSQTVQQRIFDVLINLTSYKHHKSLFMANRQIHKICLGLLSNFKIDYQYKVLSVVYNILYKNAAGIKMYRKKQVIDLLRQICDKQYNQQQKQLQCIANNIVEVLQKQNE